MTTQVNQTIFRSELRVTLGSPSIEKRNGAHMDPSEFYDISIFGSSMGGPGGGGGEGGGDEGWIRMKSDINLKTFRARSRQFDSH